jgi:hypothetical protein
VSFIPFKILSTNVMDDLLAAAGKQRISLDEIDFDLLSYRTYYKGTIDDEWQVLEGDDLFSVTTETEIRSKIFLLRQEYEINIRLAKPAHPQFDLHFAIATDKTKSRVIAQIDPASIIPLKKGVQTWIKEAITRKKLRHGLMIGIGETNLDQEINRLLLKIQKEGPLSAPYRLPIAECFPPTPPTNDAVIPHYKKIQRANNLIDGVQPDDLILEYVFPKHGRDGRNCSGNFIAVPEPIIKYAGYIVIDEETIRTEQDEGSIRFHAITSGFVRRINGIFTVSQELQLESASFKDTGSIEAGMDKDIHIKIKSKEHSKDAVGMGINIDVQKLDVDGSVGSNAKIQACELTIGAQTHKKSQINVTEVANIHLHRGNLKAKEANIGTLEAGKVEADIVRIKKMVGGEIIANKVYIGTLYSNAKITARELIEIDHIEGEGNDLIIDPRAIPSYHEKIAALEIKVRSKTSRLQEQSKEFITRQLSFKEKSARMKQFQQRLIEAKKSGSVPMKADIVRIQQYKAEAEKFKELAEELRIQEEAIHTLQSELDKLYEADLHACVTHRGIYNGHNRVIFIDPKTRQEYAITPNTRVTHIRLRKEGEEKRLVLES